MSTEPTREELRKRADNYRSLWHDALAAERWAYLEYAESMDKLAAFDANQLARIRKQTERSNRTIARADIALGTVAE